MNKPETEHLEAAQGDFNTETKMESTAFDAQMNADREKSMGLLEGLRAYPQAVFWSVVIAFAIVMDGYDGALLGSFYAHPAFKQKYGDWYVDHYEVPANWQTILSMIGSVGNILGVGLNGFIVDKFGHRKVLMGTFIYMAGIIFMYVFCPNRQVLVVAQLLFGFGLGSCAVTPVSYAAEITPVVLRGYLTTFINACWTIGQLVAQGCLKGTLSNHTDWGYRLPYALQWMWLPPLFVLTYFAPESPWWLVRKNEIEKAVKSVNRLKSKSDDSDSHQAVAMMVHTNELEKSIESGTTYLDCFKGVDLRRTEISAISFITQAASMGNVMAYSTYFFTSAGLSTDNSFLMGIIQYVIGLIGVLLSWFALTFLGRRTIHLAGLIGMFTLFLIMGFVSLAPSTNSGAQWATAGLVLAIVFIYDMTLGPVIYCTVGEISSTRLKGKTVPIARNTFNIWAIVNAVIFPYMMNPESGDWKGKVGFFQAGLCAVCLVWAFFRLPEAKGRTYEELDILFMRKVPARKFKSYEIEPLAETDAKEIEAEA